MMQAPELRQALDEAGAELARLRADVERLATARAEDARVARRAMRWMLARLRADRTDKLGPVVLERTRELHAAERALLDACADVAARRITRALGTGAEAER